MREIVEGILGWSRFSAPHGYDFNGYLVRHPSGNVCVDPVEPDAEDLAVLEREGVASIVLTNRNHGRRADLVRARTGAPVLIHPADAAHARAQGATIDGELQPGGQVGPFTVVAVPGKSPGEVALYCPRRRLLIVGDDVVGTPPGQLALLRAQVMDDPVRLRASVRALGTLAIEMLLTGDGTPVVRDAGARLAELVATFPD